MYYTDLSFEVNEPSYEVLGTFLGGADLVQELSLACHPSCWRQCDTDGLCNDFCDAISGRQILLGAAAACICTESPTDYTAGCVLPCHESCQTCSGMAANQCTSCAAPGATLKSGTCVCGDGYVYQVSPITCVACTNASKYCLSAADTYQWRSSGAYHFARVAHLLDSALPYTTTTHGLLCYRSKVVDDNDCTINALTSVVGSIGSSPYAPTSAQCSAIISSQWAYVEHWFPILFPDFDDQTSGSSYPEEILKVKTVLQLWIVQFDVYFMKSDPAWITLRNAFRRLIPWNLMLAWTSPTPKYTINSITEVAFPTDLAAWLAQVSADKAAFNTFSRVCSTCGNTHCANAIPTSGCA